MSDQSNVVQLSDYFKTCKNCVYFSQEKLISSGDGCTVPGGWTAALIGYGPYSTVECADFVRRVK